MVRSELSGLGLIGTGTLSLAGLSTESSASKVSTTTLADRPGLNAPADLILRSNWPATYLPRPTSQLYEIKQRSILEKRIAAKWAESCIYFRAIYYYSWLRFATLSGPGHADLTRTFALQRRLLG